MQQVLNKFQILKKYQETLQCTQDLKITEWNGRERDGINMGHKVLAEKLFLGKTQSDKFLYPGWTTVIFMQFEVMKERKKTL